jgi:protease-4
MEQVDLEKLARGRIYTGRRAKELKLIDEIGTLDDAVASAQKLAGLDPGEKIERLMLPKPTSPLEQFFGPLDPESTTRVSVTPVSALNALLREMFPDAAQRLQILSLTQTLSRERTMTVLPFFLSIQ